MNSNYEIEQLLGKMPPSLLWNGNTMIIIFLTILICSVFFIRVATIQLESKVTVQHAKGLSNTIILSYKDIDLDRIEDSVLLCLGNNKQYKAKIISHDTLNKHLMIAATDKPKLNFNEGDVVTLKATIRETIFHKLN